MTMRGCVDLIQFCKNLWLSNVHFWPGYQKQDERSEPMVVMRVVVLTGTNCGSQKKQRTGVAM
jgi:hypothetical protein